MGKITIVGVGWTTEHLTLAAVGALTGSAKVLLHTERCGCAPWLCEKGVPYTSLDDLYETCEDFDEHARAAADAVLLASEESDVVYGVLDVRDRSAQLLAQEPGLDIRVIAGPPVEGALLPFAIGETRAVEASEWESYHLTVRENCLIRELDSRELAAEIKLRLMEVYPEELVIWVTDGVNAPFSIPLYTLDRMEHYDHRTCVLVPAIRGITGIERYDFEHLNEIMRLLCAPDGCPWDRAQTHETLRTCMLEEAYEVIDAIDEGDTDHLYDELGDMLMQVAIHAEIARLHGEFDITDVTTAICEKLISRHTHVFGGDDARDPDQVLALWNRNKMKERLQHSYTEVMRSVTRSLPASLRAVKVLKRSAEAGLGDKDARQAVDRCSMRLGDLLSTQEPEAALGEVLFDLAAVARLMNIDPEIALNRAVNRFIDRFEAIERKTREECEELSHLDENTLRKYWDLVKL